MVTNLPCKRQRIYEWVYGVRGEIENHTMELLEVALDSTSRCRLRANQLGVLLAAGAYVLLKELRLSERGTAWARAQVETLRLEVGGGMPDDSASPDKDRGSKLSLAHTRSVGSRLPRAGRLQAAPTSPLSFQS